MTLQAVALERYPLPERGLVASILVQHAGLPEPVAAKLAQRAAGIVWENAPQAAADAVAAPARGAGGGRDISASKTG